MSLLLGYVGFEVPDNYLGKSVSYCHVRLCYPIDCSSPGSSVEFSRQEYWSGLPFPSPGDLPDPETEPGSPALQADSLLSEPSRECDYKTGKY